jgi:hypothetical protein
MNMKKARLLLVLVAALGGSALAARPHQPFVEKEVTPERSRQLKVALNDKLWIMYDMPTAELYMAWNGGTTGGTLKNATYWYGSQTHFPHWFYIAGNTYFKESVGEFFSDWAKPSDVTLYYQHWPKQPLNYKNWSVTSGGSDVFDHVANHGYFVQGDTFKFHNGLKLKSGSEIDVMEIPDFDGAGGKTNLVRKITFTGIPAGSSVKLALPTGGNWMVTGKGTLQGGALVQDADGESTITGSW